MRSITVLGHRRLRDNL